MNFRAGSLPNFTRFENSKIELLMLDVSAQRIYMKWKPISTKKNIEYMIEWCDQYGKRQVLKQPSTKTEVELSTSPGDTYWIKIECRTVVEKVVLCSNTTTIKTVFNYCEQSLLHGKAVLFVGSQMSPFHVLYRCKPKRYWDRIISLKNGIMEKYLKDNNGQSANRLNGVLQGLFFYARSQRDGSLPSSSPFGDQRMRINANQLLDPNLHNFYFGDFYCRSKTSPIHYVTIVVCRKGSYSDSYCLNVLNPILIYDNPFIQATPRIDVDCSRQYHTFYVNTRVWVEIYFTENIPLSWGQFDQVVPTGIGRSHLGGLPNNKSCVECNLYPRTNHFPQLLNSKTEPATEVLSRETELDDRNTKLQTRVFTRTGSKVSTRTNSIEKDDISPGVDAISLNS